jgi:hypothetical protein
MQCFERGMGVSLLFRASFVPRRAVSTGKMPCYAISQIPPEAASEKKQLVKGSGIGS